MRPAARYGPLVDKRTEACSVSTINCLPFSGFHRSSSVPDASSRQTEAGLNALALGLEQCPSMLFTMRIKLSHT